MDLTQLEMFVAVWEAHSVRKAAARLFRSQPALSMAIRRLEEEIGSPLFQRSDQNMSALTPAGEILYAYAKRLLRLRTEALADIQELCNSQGRRLRVAADECTSNYLLPTLIKEFRQEHPEMKVEISWQDSQQSMQDVKDGIVDLAVVSRVPAEDQSIDVSPLIEDELILVVGPHHPLKKHKRVRLADLAEESLVTQKNDPIVRETILEAFRICGLSPRIGIEVNALSTIKKLVRMNIGIAFLYRMCVEEDLSQSKLNCVSVADFQHRRRLSMVSRHDPDHSAAAQKFVTLARGHLQMQTRLTSPPLRGPLPNPFAPLRSIENTKTRRH
jgi:DNA-binding transcriptional LysR family regulator